MKEYEPHPLAELFPYLPASEIRSLVDSIRDSGLLEAIVLFEGKVLDGRHRQEACLIAKVTPRYEQYRGDNPLDFVFRKNFHRRHLTEAQRAMLAARRETLTRGGDRKSDASTTVKNQSANTAPTRTELAKTLAVSPRSIATASKILDASSSLAKQVSDGKISLNAAAVKLADKKGKLGDKKVLDDIGTEIPYDCLPFWNRRAEVQEMLTQISHIKSAIEKAKRTGDCMFGKVSNGVIDNLSLAYTQLLEAKPYAVCTTCQGRFNVQKGCSMCGNKGLISKWQWDTQSRKEIKEIRLKAATV